MARQISEIKQELMDAKASVAALDNLTSTSQVSIFGNIFYVTAVEISILEQLIDAYIANIESIINEQAIGSTAWLRAKILEFQYGDYINLDTTTFAISYPTIDETKKIITRCSVKEAGNLIVNAKVAKSDPPEALTGGEVSALQGYIDVIKPAGTQINIVSLAPDKLYIAGNIYYNGQYSAVIQDNVEAAITTYMANLSSATNFNGSVKISSLIDAIQAVEGVTDVNLTEVDARAYTVDFDERTIIYSLSTGVNDREYSTYAGYIIEEDTTDETFADTIAYIAQ